MTTNSENTTNQDDNLYDVDQAYADLVAGLEIGIAELRERLVSNIDGLTKAQMKRMLLSVINYPDIVKVGGEREEYFLKNLLGLRGCQLQAEIHAIAQSQLESDNKQGEENV